MKLSLESDTCHERKGSAESYCGCEYELSSLVDQTDQTECTEAEISWEEMELWCEDDVVLFKTPGVTFEDDARVGRRDFSAHICARPAEGVVEYYRPNKADTGSLSNRVLNRSTVTDTPEAHSFAPDWSDYADGLWDDEPDGWVFDLEDAPEFSHEVLRNDLASVQYDGRLSPSQNAQQLAFELCKHVGWSSGEMDRLTRILLEYPYSSSRLAISRLITSRAVDCDQLEVACGVRFIWRRYPEFSNCNNKRMFRFLYKELPWNVAANIAVSWLGRCCLEQIERTLLDYHRLWFNDERVFNEFGSFISYVLYRLRFPDIPNPLAVCNGGSVSSKTSWLKYGLRYLEIA